MQWNLVSIWKGTVDQGQPIYFQMLENSLQSQGVTRFYFNRLQMLYFLTK